MSLTIPQYIEIRTAAGATAAFLSPEADGIKDVEIRQELNGQCTLTFSMPFSPDNDKWQYLNMNYRLYVNGKEFVILNPDAIERQREGQKKWGKVTAHESWILLSKKYKTVSNDPQTPDPPWSAVIILSGGSALNEYTPGTAKHALKAVLNGTGWAMGTVTIPDTKIRDLEMEKESVLAVVNKIQEIWGGYLVWDSVNKTVSLYDEETWGNYTGYQIRYAKNLQGISRTEDWEIITRLYPFGENDLDIRTVNNNVLYLDNFTYTSEILEGIWVNQDIADPAVLKEEAEKYLAKVCKPRINYRVSHVYLSTLSGYQHEDFALGDLVDVIDEDLGVNVRVRVIGYTYNVFQPWKCEVEVGDPIEKIETMLVDSREMVQYLNSIKTSKGQITAYKLVDESIIAQKIAKAAVDATRLNTKTVILLDDVWTDNTPSSGYVSWNQHKLYYAGVEYTITAGNTNLKYIYWDGSSSSYLASATEPTLTDGQFIIAVNNGGLHDIVWNKGYGREFIGSLFIADAAIKSAHIDEAQILDAHIANVSANKITTGQLLAYLVEILGQKGYFKITGDGLRVYSKEGALMGHLGWYEGLADQTAVFDRNSVAYLSNGSQVTIDQPRYEYHVLPSPIWQDTFDTDQLSQYTSGGDVAATWAVSSGVLTATGGSEATLIKNNLALQDCQIVVNSDQAQGGGIIGRYMDNNNYYVLVLHDDTAVPSGGNLNLWKRVSGVFTLLASADVTWPRGTSKQIKFALHGSRLEACFDGVKVISVTDTTFTGGGVGLRQNNPVSCRYLDFTVYYAVQGMQVEEGTTNLLTANQSSVETDLTGLGSWSPNGGQVLSRDTTIAWHGVASAKLVNGNTVSQDMCVGIDAASMPVTASTPYTFSVMAKVQVSGSKYVRCDIQWFDANKTYITTTRGTPQLVSSASGWVKVSVTGTAPSTAAYCDMQFFLLNAAPNEILWWDGAQFEAKSYPTTWTLGGSTRSAEVLTAPTAGVFTKGSWTVKLRYAPTSRQDSGRHDRLWEMHIDANNYYLLHHNPSGYLRLAVASGGIEKAIIDSVAMEVGQTYFIMISGNGSVMRLCKNGVQVGTDVSYTEPVGNLPANMYIACDYLGGEQPNGIISDFAVMSKAQTLAEHQAEYWSGKPLVVDEYTTYLMSCNGTLKPTVRRFGLWSKNGEVTLVAPPVEGGIRVYDASGNLRAHIGQYAAGKYGLKITNGEIYSTRIRTGSKTSTSYINLEPGWEPLEVIHDGKLALDIWSTPDWGGFVNFYDVALNDMRGSIHAYNDGVGQGLRIEGRNTNGYNMPLDLIGLGMYLAADDINITNRYHTTGTDVTVWGDLHVTGTLSAGSKSARQQTKSFGERYLYVRESPDVRYIDEGDGILVNGECRVDIDPIFLECVEPNTPATKWRVYITPMSRAIIDTIEIGDTYFIVRGEPIDKEIPFNWILSCVRKGFAGVRLEEVIEEDVLTSNWEDELGVDV